MLKGGIFMDERALREAARQFEENLSKYPIEVQIAVGLISKNVLNGCSWEFTRDKLEIKKCLPAFDKSDIVSASEVTYNHERQIRGYLIYMKFDVLLRLLSKEAPGLITEKDVKIANENRQKHIVALAKLMKKGFTGRIGIYCTNDSQAVTVNGKTYPAFAVTFKELLQICNSCGYGILVKGVSRRPAELERFEDKILKASIVAPSSNAMFIDIAPVR